MRAIGLDVGERRIGLAAGDSESAVAVPVGVLERTSTGADVEAVLAEASSRAADTVVVGVPYTLRGARGHQAASVEAFVEELRGHTRLAVVTVDERLTSVEAERRLAEATPPRKRGPRPRASAGAVDAAAAAVILQAYLDGRRTDRA